MQFIQLAAICGALLAGTVDAYGGNMKNTTRPGNTTTILPPKQDPWYTAPTGFEGATPGAVLRTRAAPGLTKVYGNSSAAYQMLYRTTDSHYRPTWAVTTLLVPRYSLAQRKNGSNYSTTDVLLSFQIPYDSADVDASPSYALYDNHYDNIDWALHQGWYVNIPDYEGPKASFAAGVISGHATIDSIRASLENGHGLKPGAKYAMWGYSGGALASEWAAELAVQYAPELTFAGAAMGGLTPNISNVLISVSGGVSAGLAPNGINGLSSQYPELMAYFHRVVKTTGEYNATTFFGAHNETLAESILTFFDQDISNYFTDSIPAILDAPVAQRALNRDGQMGYHGVPQMPIFAYKAIDDEISPTEDTDALVAKYCNVGASIWYQRNTIGNHITEETNGAPRAFAWLKAILMSDYTQSGCRVHDITVQV